MGKKRRSKKIQAVDANDIDEQLRLQRLKKQQASSNVEEKKVATNASRTTLGGFVYDPIRDAYFPKEFVQSRKRSLSRSDDNGIIGFPAARSQSFPHVPWHLEGRVSTAQPPVLCHVAQLCQRPFHRQRVLSRWNGRMHLESLNVQTVPCRHVRSINPYMYDAHFEYASGHLDSACFAPWQRTFDVSETSDLQLPLVVSVGKSTPEVLGHSNQSGSACGHHVKVLPTIRDDCGDGTRAYGHCMSLERWTRFRLWDGGSLVLEEELPESNDFAALSSRDWIVLGGNKGSRPCYNYRRQEFVTPCVLDKATSDLLCVETDSTTPDEVYFGQRDGAVSMRDVRTSHQVTNEQSKLWWTRSKDNFGSVVGMQLLFDQRPHQILVRGSMKTSCRLLDVRRMGGCHYKSAIVYEMTLPSNERNDSSPSSITAPTKGMATDPCRTMSIVPFTDGSKQACLGMWSLDSGEFVGKKIVEVNRSNSSEIREGQVMELSSRVTRAYNLKAPWLERAKIIPGFHGLWIEYGVHGVHHVIVNGRANWLATGKSSTGSLHDWDE